MKTALIALLLTTAAPAFAWLPDGHPAARTSSDGCTVDVPRLTITRLCAVALPFTVSWDLDGDGTYERVETHTRSEHGWSAYGPPVRFPTDAERVVRWRVTIPCGTAIVVPQADCRHPAPDTYDCSVMAEVNGCPTAGGRCESDGPPTVIEGEARYSPAWWRRMDAYLGHGRACGL